MKSIALWLLCLQTLHATVIVFQSVRDAFERESDSNTDTRPTVAVLTLPLSKILQRKVKESFERQPVLEPGADLLNEVGRMSFFPSSYAKWLERQNIRVLPLDINEPDSQLHEIMNKVNGLLLTGGAVNLYHPDRTINIDGDVSRVHKIKEPSRYSLKVASLIDHAKKINQNGRHFPVWGTCLGFESMMLTESDYSLPLNRVFNLNTNRPLYFSKTIPSPAQKKVEVDPDEEDIDPDSEYVDPKKDLGTFLSEEDRNKLASQDLTFFNHENGFFPKDILQNDKMRKNYRIVAVSPPKSKDIKQPLVAMVENKHLPFFAVQFHPEKIYEHSQKIQPNRSPEATRLAERLSKFFVDHTTEEKDRPSSNIFNSMNDYQVFKSPNIGVFDEVYLMRKRARRQI